MLPQSVHSIEQLNGTKIKEILLTTWMDRESQPGIFAYKLNIRKQKVLPGKCQFLVQLNEDRTTRRRKPQIIDSICPRFDETKFNFNKVDASQILFKLRSDDEYDQKDAKYVTFLINNSPLTPYHSLICPEMESNLSQILRLTDIEFVLRLLYALNDRSLRIGYNSPGALASINHLHFHILSVPERVYVESAKLIHFIGNVFLLDNCYAAKAFCFRYSSNDAVKDVAESAFKIIKYLLVNNVPHNIFLTFEEGTQKIIRLYIYPREIIFQNKEVAPFNVAFCELSGFVPVGKYCKNHQSRPFSHIVMDIFKTVSLNNKAVIPCPSREKPKIGVLLNNFLEEHRSDTDSGRSSEHGEIDVNKQIQTCSTNELRINRNNNERRFCSLPRPKHSTIGYGSDLDTRSVGVDNAPSRKHPLVRRRMEALKKRNEFRRNTVDVTEKDLQRIEEMTRLEQISEKHLSLSKSTNCIDKVEERSFENSFYSQIQAMNFGNKARASMPDLSSPKIATLPNLRVKRHRSERVEPIAFQRLKGPEFAVKSHLPAKQIDICDAKCQQRRCVNVLLLTGSKIQILCNPLTTTARHVFETVIRSEGLVENFFLGLCALIGGDFVFIPYDLKIYKVAPQIWINTTRKSILGESLTFSLFLRVKYFLPTLRGVSSPDSRHLLYLQLRKSILEQQILCTEDDLITLGGLALQAEFGDFQENMRHVEYFSSSHYIPENAHVKEKELAKYIRNSHFGKRGLMQVEAEQNFIRYMQELKEYGMHLYSATWLTDDNMNLDVYCVISLNGVAIFERNQKQPFIRKQNEYQNSKNCFQRHLYTSFEWIEIENICFSKHILCVIANRNESMKDKCRSKYKFKMDGRKSYFAFILASEHHKFYLKLRNSFISLKALSDELNIPLAERRGGGSERRKIEVNCDDYEVSKKEAQIDVKNIEKIDKPSKSSGLRVRNLKKSMLNDNRLLKLRDRFLKRSKSSVAACSEPRYRSTDHDKEEAQNKENEYPRTFSDIDSSPKMLNVSRNKVKMGTRVFSSQFLNRSIDNIYDGTTAGVENLSVSCSSFTDLRQNVSLHDNNRCLAVENSLGDDDEEASSIRSVSISSCGTFEQNFEKNFASSQKAEACVLRTSIKSIPNTFLLNNDESVSESLLEKFQNLSCSNPVDDRVIRRLTIIKESQNNSSIVAAVNDTKEKNNYLANVNINSPDNRGRSKLNVKYGSMHDVLDRLDAERQKEKNALLARSQSILSLKNNLLNQNNGAKASSSRFTLGISIVQGSDGNVYVKDVAKNGPGDKSGIRIGDQLLAVNGISLLNRPYAASIKLLQNVEKRCDLVVSQVCPRPLLSQKGSSRPVSATTMNVLLATPLSSKSKSINNINDKGLLNRNDLNCYESPLVETAKYMQAEEVSDFQEEKRLNVARLTTIREHGLNSMTPSKSLPELPKIVEMIPKAKSTSRKYTGPVKYPVTPARKATKTKAPLKHHLSLLAADSVEDKQVFI